MTRFTVATKPLFAFVLLAAFLAGGVSLRVSQGPLEDGQRILGFQPDTTRAGVDPACILRGEVGRGVTLSQVLDREGMPRQEAHEFLLQLASLTDMKSVRPDDEYRLFSNRTGLVTRLEFQSDPARYFVVEKDSSGLRAWRQDEPVEQVTRKITGTVNGSLYASMVADGVSPSLVATFCDVFSYDVDFATETKDGDVYEILVEERQMDGFSIGGDRLLGGRFMNGGKTAEVVYFEKEGGRGQFYHPNGESIRRAFLKSPLNYSRISSGFTYKRRHPIFKTVRPHLGVDYAAPTGTPVVTVADGTVQSSGWVNGYGKLVRVKHTNGIVTYYAHLSRFGKGIRAGSKVNQNQVIGYVGQTGHATGPHLDFRIQQGGKFIDPLRFKSSAGEPLTKGDRPAFEEALRAYRGMMDEAEAPVTAQKL